VLGSWSLVPGSVLRPKSSFVRRAGSAVVPKRSVHANQAPWTRNDKDHGQTKDQGPRTEGPTDRRYIEERRDVTKLEWCEKELHGDHRKWNRDDNEWQWSEK
jgi:hypothetical protein